MNKNIIHNNINEEEEKFVKIEMQNMFHGNKLTNINYLKINKHSNDKNKYLLVYILHIFYNQLLKLKQKIKKIDVQDIVTFIFSIISIILYIKGLEGCVGDEVYCLTKMGVSFFKKIIIINLISCVILSIILMLITLRELSFFHLLYLIPSYIMIMYIDQGTTLDNHGYYNTLGYITFLIIIYPFLIVIYIMLNLIQEKKYKIFISISFIILIICIWFILYVKIKTKCDGWDIGLNNTRIYNNEDEYACQINLPKKCYINIFDGKLNMSNILNLKCDLKNFYEKKLLFDFIKDNKNNYIKSNTKKVGYPLLNKGDFPENKQNGIKRLSLDVMKNLVDMDNLPPHITPDKIPEIYIDFNDYPDDKNSKYGKVHINIKKNETLINERKKNAEKNKVIFNNIIVIFIDTLSRAHINRKLPKLKAWLEKFMKYDIKDYINYQFLKFHSLGVHTLLNLKPFIFGESVLSPYGINKLKYMKEKGYITAQADNYCGTKPYQIRKSFDHSKVKFEYFDHELISLFCDPNYYIYKDHFSLKKGPSAALRRCLYGQDTFHYIFEYSKLFWRTYKGNRRYLRLASMDSHEGTGELISLMEHTLIEFLDDLYKNGDLKDTALFLFSDHGNHMSPHLSLMPGEDVEIEKIMPFFFLLLPKKNNNYQNDLFLDEFYENLYKNQQSLVTTYDIHNTLIHIIFNERDLNKAPYSKEGNSLFNLINNKNRTCDNYPEIFKKKSPGTLTCNCIKFKKK